MTIDELRQYVPPKLWSYGHHVFSLTQYFKHDRFRDLKRNHELAGKFAGQRGFVVGNGASLKEMNLRRLDGERVFTVNRFLRHAPELRPAAHVFLDPAYFTSLANELDGFASVRDPQTICFAPLQYRDVVRRSIPDAHFLFMSGTMDVNTNGDLTRPVANMQTVTIAALLIALYMGCSPIYLIGCDMDILNHVESVNPLRLNVPHFYDHKVDVVTSELDYPDYIHAVWRMFDGYRLIKENVANGRPIYNAGVGGLLDLFERVDFESLFKTR